MPDFSHIQAFPCDIVLSSRQSLKSRSLSDSERVFGKVYRVSKDAMTEIQVRRKVLLRLCSMSLCCS